MCQGVSPEGMTISVHPSDLPIANRSVAGGTEGFPVPGERAELHQTHSSNLLTTPVRLRVTLESVPAGSRQDRFGRDRFPLSEQTRRDRF